MSGSAITQVPRSNALFSVRELVALAHPGLVYLFQGESDVLYVAMQEMIDRLALQAPVQVVAGGNRISFEHLPLIAGEQIGNIYEILDRIWVSRDETCYQMQDVLQALKPSAAPLVITDMLASFYEDDLTDREVTIVLKNCLAHIQRISETAPVLISARADAVRPALIEMLERRADMRFYFEPSNPPNELQTVLTGM
ncbi:MAG: hypothetical protein ACRDFQ_09775 [Anaerolineales bacterium]